MNEIQMIRIEMLQHHPENPRLDLGDLTELTESIRQNGIMQNLTVVMVDDGIYNVVIGNRRMEAAKLAGLAEVPCVVSDMDYKTQIATMLMENMQRQDLTVYEQAKGFQMMMDLGFSAKEIGEKTGFSEKTVKDRIKFTKFNQKNFEKAVAAGATLMDMIEVSKLESKTDQNEVMKEAGTNNFRQMLNRKLGEQKYRHGCEKLKKIASGSGVEELPSQYSTWQDCDRREKSSASEEEEKIRKTIKKVQKEAKGQQLYYKFDRDWQTNAALLIIYTLKEPKEEKDPTEEELAQKEAERQKMRYRRQVRKLWGEAYQLRFDFVKNYTLANGASLTTIGKLITKYALSQRKTWGNNDLTENHNWKAKYVREVLGLKKEDYEDTKSIWEEAERRGDIPAIRLAVAWMMGGGVFDCDTPESRMTDWDENFSEEGVMANMIKERYEFLKEIGYVMSDMEIQLMDGTHECYQRKGA